MSKSEMHKIIANRSILSERISTIRMAWQKRTEKVAQLRDELKGLRKICLRARSGDDSGSSEAIKALESCLDDFERNQVVRKLGGECTSADFELGKLALRFDRTTLNVAVAGVGRCGKSTALKAIIGQNQNDNSVIPSGSGPAVTAGKSVIRCVATADEEHTEIEYHTENSFLNDVVNPLLSSISLSNRTCRTLAEFEELDYELLKEEVSANGRAAEATVRALRTAPIGDETEADRQIRISAAQAYAGEFKLYLERLNDLRRIMEAFAVFRGLLTGRTESIPISETSRYVSYPKDGGPAICHAVRNCCIFSRFPNNEVAELVLIDLPGLGTGSESEKKCFFAGFDYSVDLALTVRRPEGLFQNFTTEDDLTVLNVLGGVFGEEHLHECMILFQNDGGLPTEGTNPAMAKIDEWNANRTHPITVVRGDAFSFDFMQKHLLPEALKFMERNLPALDEALIDDVLPALQKRAADVDAQIAKVQMQLRGLMTAFPATEGANAIADKAAEFESGLLMGLSRLMDRLSDSLKTDERLSESITSLSDEAKRCLSERYDDSDERKLGAVANRIRVSQSPIPYANDEIHSMRIAIGEVFSKLGTVHADQFAGMRQAVASLFVELMPTVFPPDAELEDVHRVISASGCCIESAAAINALIDLDAPFYNIIYPDLRKEVFDAVSEVEKSIIAVPGDSPEKKAKNVMHELRNTGENWVWKAERMLRTQSRVPEIICAALERLQDRIVRSAVARREWVDFLERNWSQIQSGADSCAADIRGRLAKIVN